jgi:hypothetical protein
MAWHTRETVDFDSAASAPRASARVFSTSRTDSPRTNPVMTSVSNAWDLVTPLPNNWLANALAAPRSLGRATLTGPAVVLIVVWQKPLRLPGRASGQPAARW